MGSKEVYSHYLLEVKRDYTKQLCNLLVPVMYEGILSLYNTAKKARNDVPMKMFQLVLSKVPDWNQHTITTEYNRIIAKTNCEWINELITAVFISHAKILSSIKTKKKTKTLNLKIPNGDYFIHKAYIECARQFWKNPYLLFDEVNSIEYQRNLRDSELIIEQCIEESVRKLLPIRNILQQYIAIDEDSSSSSSSDDEEPEQPPKKNKSKDVNDYNEEYVTQSISEKGKKKLEESVRKTLKTSIKTEDDDKFSNYSISHDIPIKKKKNNEKKDDNNGIVNIVSSNNNNSIKEGGVINNTNIINEINNNKFESELYKSLNDSNSISISLDKENKKSSKNFDIPLEQDIKSINIENLLDLDIKKENLSNNHLFESKSKKSKDVILNNNITDDQFSFGDISLNWDNNNQHNNLLNNSNTNIQNNNDKKSEKISEIKLDIKSEHRPNKNTEISSYKRSISSDSEFPTSFHEDEIINFQNDNNIDKKSSNQNSKNIEFIQNSGDNLSNHIEKKLNNINNKSDNSLKSEKNNEEKYNNKIGLDIEIFDYVKKTNLDTESMYNLSMDFDIKDPKTFINSNSSETRKKIPISLVLNENDIKNSINNENQNTKNIIINTIPNHDNPEQVRKTSLKKRYEKKNYNFLE